MFHNKIEFSQEIKTEAIRLGFSNCGISRAKYLAEEEPMLQKWLDNQMNGEMTYMENHFEKRLDATKLMEGAKSVISVILNYYQPNLQIDINVPIISKYAYGIDYHFLMKAKLQQLLNFVIQNTENANGRCFVDSAPVLERAYAVQGGLGWIGKSSNLITKQGTFFFIGELIVDVELQYDTPSKNYCGNCTRCIDACPTKAIVAPYTVDARKCISYLTIEYRGDLPTEMKAEFQNRVFGCDICMDVCPYNRKATPHNEPQLMPSKELTELTVNQWQTLAQPTFQRIFKNSPVKRTKYEGLRRNIDFLSTNYTNFTN